MLRHDQGAEGYADVLFQLNSGITSRFVVSVKIEQLHPVEQGDANTEKIFLPVLSGQVIRFVKRLTGKAQPVSCLPLEALDHLDIFPVAGLDERVLHVTDEILVCYGFIQDIVQPMADHQPAVHGRINAVRRENKITHVQAELIHFPVHINIACGVLFPMLYEKREHVV